MVYVALVSVSPMDIGVRNLKTVLDRRGVESDLFVFDRQPLRNGYSEGELFSLTDYLKKRDDKIVVGVSSIEQTYHRARQILNACKEAGINARYFVGGPFPKVEPTLCLADGWNVVFLGEAEKTLQKVLEGDLSSGVATVINGNVVTNPLSIDDFLRGDEIPNPFYGNAFEFKDGALQASRGPYKSLDHPQYGTRTSLDLFTQWGCSYSCGFCEVATDDNLYGKKIRRQSVDQVVDSIADRKRKNGSLDYVSLWDLDFLLRPLEEIQEFSSKYRKSVGLPFFIFVTPRTASKEDGQEKLRLLVEAGLDQVNMGIQCGNEAFRRRVYTRMDFNEQIITAANTLHALTPRVKLMYDIIISNPWEKREEVADTAKLLLQLPPPFYLTVEGLALSRGTPLFERARTEGLVNDAHFVERDYHDVLADFRGDHYMNSVIYIMRGEWTKERCGLLWRKNVPTLLNNDLAEEFDKLDPNALRTFLSGLAVDSSDRF